MQSFFLYIYLYTTGHTVYENNHNCPLRSATLTSQSSDVASARTQLTAGAAT